MPQFRSARTPVRAALALCLLALAAAAFAAGPVTAAGPATAPADKTAGPKAYVTLTLPADAPFAAVAVTIDGQALGTLEKGKPKKYWVTPDAEHRIVARQEKDGKVWRCTHVVTLKRDEHKTIVLKLVLITD